MHRSHIMIILLVLLLAGCAPSSGLTSETIAIVPTFTNTVPPATSTQTPTYTPEKTPLPAATRTAVATYTPAVLSKTSDATYRLSKWTANQADLLIDQIFSQLTASENDPGYHGIYGYANYIEQYKYLAFVESEALLRFPDAQQAETWRWDVCYNLALSYVYPEASDAPDLPCYAKLIEAGLNSGQIDLSNLSNWFRTHESRFPFEITANTPPQGYASSHIISLDMSFLWVLEKDGKFQVTGLRSSMFYFQESSADFQLLDLTGDHYPELILNFKRAFCCGNLTTSYVYDLSSGIPQQLYFMEQQGTQYSHLSGIGDTLITGLDARSLPGLLLKKHYGDPLVL